MFTYNIINYTELKLMENISVTPNIEMIIWQFKSKRLNSKKRTFKAMSTCIVNL